ncbi:MAG TPA: 6-carboxytetrahydropterin synthase QueD [Bacteroidales bacterium]|nr:6-carboxytetrahydropterin synthase QueD [Bacteroidales bacterium]
MTKVRLTKIFEFEAAHALHDYDGLCRNIHGHSYKLYVTIIGQTINDPKSPKYGMVMDFGDLKQLIKPNIVDEYDHSILLSSKENLEYIKSENQLFKRIHILEFQPTAENMVLHFAKIIKSLLPAGVELHSIKLYETATSFAEWYAEDQ